MGIQQGPETLQLRMDAHSSRAMTLANWLVSHDKVSMVNYCGLETHPDHELAKSQQSAFGGVLSFEVIGGQAEAWAFINSTRLMSLTANLGDVKTTICHPHRPPTVVSLMSRSKRRALRIR